MPVKSGSAILIYVTVGSELVPVASSLNATLSINGSPIDVTTKDSAGWRELIAGQKSWSLAGDGKFNPEASNYSFSDLFGLLSAGSEVVVRISEEISGDTYYEGSALVTALEMSAPMDDASTFSFTFEGTGELNEASS